MDGSVVVLMPDSRWNVVACALANEPVGSGVFLSPTAEEVDAVGRTDEAAGGAVSAQRLQEAEFAAQRAGS